MAVETLKIVLTADNKEAIAAMRETVTSLDGVAIAGKKGGDAMKKVGTDFTGVSRVIQDMPYGFNAIANNLTNILPAAGALGLGISALVAGMQFAQLGTQGWRKELSLFTGTLSLADQVNQNYTKSLSEEKVKLDSLFKTAQDNNQTLKVRQEAVTKLRDSYGAYLKGYTDEEILVGKAAKAHDLLTESIKKQSIQQAALALAAPIQQKILELEIKNINERTKAIEDWKKASGKSTAMGGVGGTGTYSTQQQERDIVRNTFLEKQRKIVAEIAVEQAKLNQLQDIAAKNAVVKLTDTKDSKAKTETKKKEVDLLKQESEEMLKQSLLLNTLKGKMAGEGVQAQEKRKLKDLTNLKLTTDGNQALNEVMLRQSEIQDQRNANLALANNLTDYAMQGLTNLVNVMANGGNIGAALGDMFKKLAVDIALAAAKAAIFQAILSAINPGAAVGGGGFLKTFGKMLGFAEGGTVSGPTTGYPVMLHGTEHIVRPDQMKSIIASASQMGGTSGGRVEVFGRIQGQDIWLSQQRTNTFRKLST